MYRHFFVFAEGMALQDSQLVFSLLYDLWLMLQLFVRLSFCNSIPMHCGPLTSCPPVQRQGQAMDCENLDSKGACALLKCRALPKSRKHAKMVLNSDEE